MKITILFLLQICASVMSSDLLNKAINESWAGFIDRNINQSPFLIHRPYSETPGDAVSEGVGYGMILSIYNDDQIHFDLLFDGADATMWNGRYYDWRVNQDNQKTAYGAATDAEQDIAAMLFMAIRKMDNGSWNKERRNQYLSRALQIIDNLWNDGIQSLIVRPGYGWGGVDFVNPGYFAPAWYRIFHDYDPMHNWLDVVDKCYEIIAQSKGFAKGLVPDWMSPDGSPTVNLGYNAYLDGKALYKDAIRIYWRLGTDYLWFHEPRAFSFLEKAHLFLQDSCGGIKGANFFKMDGELLPDADIWQFDGGYKIRPRREHSHLTIGMWSFPVGICGDKKGAINELSLFYEIGNKFWGKTSGNETIDINELYFDQFLASFGALYLTDRWVLL
jgi:endo-1,4-beta-D-glucanase Y